MTYREKFTWAMELHEVVMATTKYEDFEFFNEWWKDLVCVNVGEY